MIVRVAVKGGICYAAVHYTRQLGVWGTSDDTHKLYNQIHANLEPVCKKVKSTVNYQPPSMPSSGEIGFITNYYYNEGVKGTFRFIKMIPCYIGQGIKKVNEGIKGAMEAKPE